jgi:DNA-binding MarR family transcriptional regulator
MDHVDGIIAQWRRERPDLDVGPMEVIGRLVRVKLHLDREMERIFARHGLNTANFDVLATLRRAGRPFALSPGELAASMLVTSGTMTNRIDQLEKIGHVVRVRNPDDGRGFHVRLTAQGLVVIEAAIVDHVANQRRLISALPPDQQDALNDILRRFTQALEERGPLALK